MDGFQYAVAACLPIVIFPQTMAPTFRYGFPGTFGLVIIALVAVAVTELLHIRFSKKASSEAGSSSTNDDGEAGNRQKCAESPKYDDTANQGERACRISIDNVFEYLGVLAKLNDKYRWTFVLDQFSHIGRLLSSPLCALYGHRIPGRPSIGKIEILMNCDCA